MRHNYPFKYLFPTPKHVTLEPLMITYWISEATERWDICRYVFVSAYVIGYVLCAVSLMTITLVSLDRLLALFLGLRYRQVVTLKRTYLPIIVRLGYLHRRCNNVLCEPICNFLDWQYRYNTLLDHINLVLYQNFHYSA